MMPTLNTVNVVLLMNARHPARHRAGDRQGRPDLREPNRSVAQAPANRTPIALLPDWSSVLTSVVSAQPTGPPAPGAR